MENICTKEADEFLKELIYKNKVIIFGKKNCDFTNKAEMHFKEKYKFNPIRLDLDKEKLSSESNKNFKSENLICCLKKRTKINITPMIYLNGMFLGNFKDLENNFKRSNTSTTLP